MELQLVAVWVIVAAAALYVTRAFWKSLRGSGKGCGSGCGKCTPTNEEAKDGRIPLEQVMAKRH
jgi:attachment p12 family protein